MFIQLAASLVHREELHCNMFHPIFSLDGSRGRQVRLSMISCRAVSAIGIDIPNLSAVLSQRSLDYSVFASLTCELVPWNLAFVVPPRSGPVDFTERVLRQKFSRSRSRSGGHVRMASEKA